MVIACGKVTRLRDFVANQLRSGIEPVVLDQLIVAQPSVPQFDQPTGRVIAQVGASDALLDAMAFSRGRFAVSMPGSPALVLPVGAEVDHVVEDCRS